MVASQMKQKLGLLRVAHLIEAKGMIAELKSLQPRLMCKNPKGVEKVNICNKSDASIGAGDEVYVQTGTIELQ